MYLDDSSARLAFSKLMQTRASFADVAKDLSADELVALRQMLRDWVFGIIEQIAKEKRR